MSIRLITWALDETPADLAPREVLALVAIAERCNSRTRLGWPGLAEIARRIRASERTAQRILSGLVERGLLERVGGGHRGQATVYRLPGKDDTQTSPNPDPKGRHSPVALSAAKGRHSGTERTTFRSPKDDTAVSSQPSEPSENPHPRARADEIEAVIGVLGERTGKIIDEDHAAKVVRHLIDGRADVRDRVRYLIGAIRRDSDPWRFTPTPGPPPYQGWT